MSEDELAILMKQKEELEEKILQLKNEKIKRDKEDFIANNPINITKIEIIGERVFFESTYRDDFIVYLRTISSRQWNGKSNSVLVKDWKFIEECPLPNFHLNLTEEELIAIKTWTPPPKFYVSIDDRGFKIKLGTQSGINASLIYSLPGAEIHNTKEGTLYRVILAEGWRVFDRLKDFPPEEVKWDDDALEYCVRLIEQRKLLDEIATLEDYPMDLSLNGEKLRGFQNVGARFGELANFNLIIGDEMGLGKTPQALALTELIDKKYGNDSKHLIICPASIKSTFVRAIKKFTGQIPYELFGEVPSTVDILQVLKGEYKFYIGNYDIISTASNEKKESKDEKGFQHLEVVTRRPWVELFNLASFKSIIVDEAHKIKNIDSKRSQAIRAINIPHKILLSGTPMLNRPGELWALINYLNPSLVGAYDTFIRRYTYDKKTARNVDELREILKPIMIRRTKKQVMKDLPPINRIIQYVDLSTEARKVYTKAEEGFWTEFDMWDSEPTNSQIITSMLAQIMKLKQICAKDKASYTADLASDLHESFNGDERNKVLVFTQFVNSPPVVEDIAVRLRDQGSLIITGEIHPSDRLAIVDKFQADNDDFNFLVCSITAAGEGLNITKAGAVVFNDLMWTPASHHQAEGRAYGRINDPHSISSYYLVCKGTIEEDIMELLEAKLNMFNEIVEGAEASRDTSIAMELLSRLKARRFSK